MAYIYDKQIMRGGLVELPTLGAAGKPPRVELIPFLFNPTDLEESDSHQYAKTTVPLWADPINQYVGGQGASIKFTIYLEQMRMNEIFRRPKNSNEFDRFFGEKEVGQKNRITTTPFGKTNINFTRTLSEYIERIETMKYPRRSGKDGQLFVNAPPRIMVVMGKWYRIGYIEKTSTKYLEFYSKRLYNDGSSVSDGDVRSAEMSIDMILAYGRSAPENRFVKV